MNRIKDFKAVTYSGIAGPLIVIEGKVNCGLFQVEPSIGKKDPQGTHPSVLQIVAFPAVDLDPGSFRDASVSYSLAAQGQYEEVEIFDAQGEFLDRIKIAHQ